MNHLNGRGGWGALNKKKEGSKIRFLMVYGRKLFKIQGKCTFFSPLDLIEVKITKGKEGVPPPHSSTD